MPEPPPPTNSFSALLSFSGISDISDMGAAHSIHSPRPLDMDCVASPTSIRISQPTSCQIFLVASYLIVQFPTSRNALLSIPTDVGFRKTPTRSSPFPSPRTVCALHSVLVTSATMDGHVSAALMYPATISAEPSSLDVLCDPVYLIQPSASTVITPPARTREGAANDSLVVIWPFPPFGSTSVFSGTRIATSFGSCASPKLISTACAAPLPQHIITTRRSNAELNTCRDMLGLCGSLSLPSLLLPVDPVTRRRLCVRVAFTAATRESIQICVWTVCVLLLVLSLPSNFTVAIRAW
ncbi:hypothetical protein ECC02_006532 [Trypanosoma cruzi]|uniref:Uncharacterized protein n=1 Tax=Trypanosoma cruzi TaxID=5693 RepID=A0A7J6Y140_TRYCR|nr:hypothetical protein ECC02_006532 [Trypanosoma cruzi]